MAAKLVNSPIMTSSPHYAPRQPEAVEADAVPVIEGEEILAEPLFDHRGWEETRIEDGVAPAGARMVLGWGLALLALLWVGYAAWSGGRALGAEPLTSPAIAQWIAILTGPLALLGLVWLMFGRTRRKESERFTRSVVAMRTEARNLQDVLGALSRQIEDNHTALGVMAGDLMGLGDQAASRLGSVTADLNEGSRKLAEHSAALDRAAESARSDFGIMLADLPQAEATAMQMAATLRDAGRTAIEQTSAFQAQVESLSSRTREADQIVTQATERLLVGLANIDTASASATARINEAGTESIGVVDALLAKAADALSEIRSGIDAQSAAVSALLSQSQAGIGRAGIDAAEQLGERIAAAGAGLDGLTARIAEQKRASQRLIADLDTGLAALDDKFMELARTGDDRASHVQVALGRLRGELEALSGATATQDSTIEGLSQRTSLLREGIDQLGLTLQGQMADALGHAEAGANRLLASAESARPHVEAIRLSSFEAADRLEQSVGGVSAQQEQLAQLMTSIDLGVGQAEQRLAELSASIAAAGAEAQRLQGETGPALVAALVQVRETATQAAERAREAIARVIPESTAELSQATRAALEQAVRDSVETKLKELDQVAARAVENAREASDRLTHQMLSIGQSAAALEAHIERSREAQRKDSGEEFAKRVSLLMDSMNSAAIDVQKILSDEVDEKAWHAYMKGNRGVFTRRAVRLIGGTETRAIAQQFETDAEFQESVNRYVHDFEAMLRRVLAERDGGMIAVTLMSSDMGKLYAALSQAIERRR